MKLIPISLILMAAASVFANDNIGKIIEVSRSPAGCGTYSTFTLLHTNGTTTTKYRLSKGEENFKDILAVALSGLTSGLTAVIDYTPDDNSCGTTFYLNGMTLKAQ